MSWHVLANHTRKEYMWYSGNKVRCLLNLIDKCAWELDDDITIEEDVAPHYKQDYVQYFVEPDPELM